jgi:hypothetical protein
VPIPPPLQGNSLVPEIEAVLDNMSNDQRANPRFFPENYEVWI